MSCPLLRPCFAARFARGGSDGELIGDESSAGELKRGGGRYLGRLAFWSSLELSEAARLRKEMEVPVKRTLPDASTSESLTNIGDAMEEGGVEDSARGALAFAEGV